jgi:glycosyltransferase involved in cell wall biosynthesis
MYSKRIAHHFLLVSMIHCSADVSGHYAMKVSVSVITYNQEDYIAQALDSVLMQETDFEFEILIGEDDSSDGTRAIVKDYQRRHPSRIRLLLNDRKDVIYINGRATGRWNFINNLNNARGTYIALLEGDDYWSDPLKLQKQADFLDQNADCSACFHWVQWLDQSLEEIAEAKYGPSVVQSRYVLDDLLRNGNFISTCSLMFRNRYPETLPAWYYGIPVGDLPLHILNAKEGAIGLIDETMAVYRRHEGGIYGGQSEVDNCNVALETYAVLGASLGLSRKRSFRSGVLRWETRLVNAHREQGRLMDALLAGWRAVKVAPGNKKLRTLAEVTVACLPARLRGRVRRMVQHRKQRP